MKWVGKTAFIVLIFSQIMACTSREKPKPNADLVAKEVLTAFQKEARQQIERLRAAGITFDFDTAGGKIVGIILKPDDLEYRPQKRLDELNGLSIFIETSIKKYHGKKIMYQGAFREIIDASEKTALTRGFVKINNWIKHFQLLLDNKSDGNFLTPNMYSARINEFLHDRDDPDGNPIFKGEKSWLLSMSEEAMTANGLFTGGFFLEAPFTIDVVAGESDPELRLDILRGPTWDEDDDKGYQEFLKIVSESLIPRMLGRTYIHNFELLTFTEENAALLNDAEKTINNLITELESQMNATN